MVQRANDHYRELARECRHAAGLEIDAELQEYEEQCMEGCCAKPLNKSAMLNKAVKRIQAFSRGRRCRQEASRLRAEMSYPSAEQHDIHGVCGSKT